MKLNTILCPVDYSSGSDHAVEIASRIATPSHSRVIVLTVSDPSKEEGEASSMAEAFAKNTRSKVLDQIFEEKGISVEHLNLRGDPTEVIVSIAATKHADAIAINAPILNIQTKGALLKEVTAFTAREIFFRSV